MISLIPKPKKCKEGKGFFNLDDDLKIKSDFDLPLIKNKMADESAFCINKNPDIAKEGYTLYVTEDAVTIQASTKIGAYYALQTVRKIGKTDLNNKKIPCCEIEDEPRFSWRGINIDEARHFFGEKEIKRYLDFMFMEKLNVLHWHLTDDQGWRIEIKKYPLLTQIGSKREYTHVGGWRSKKLVYGEHSGYYTQEQIKDIIAYAKERGIMIVPEIDFPAHCAAALAAYKHLACREIQTKVPGYFGGIIPEKTQHIKSWNRTVCCGKESTFEFIFGVLDEVCELFDAPYLHMGGDEAPHGEWHKCSECQRVMKENGLANEDELQGWFENRISDYLKTKNKKLIGWNEVLKAKNINTKDKNIVVQYWTPQRDRNAERYVNNGGEMIMSNHQSFYFDMTYAQYSLDKTYNYQPENFGVNSKNVKNILGFEGEIWTEWIADREKLDLMAFPRIQALSEAAWSMPENKNWDDFKKRLDDYKPVLEALGINYAVDKISLPKGLINKSRIQSKFYKGNPYLEVELNKNYKAKGDK